MITKMNWVLATQRYQAEGDAKKLAETERSKSEEAKKQKEREEARKKQEEAQQGTQELHEFLISEEGGAAIRLLQASNQHIILGEDQESGGYRTVYLMDGNGLQQSVEASGTWVAYSKNVPKPKITPISTQQAIEAAVNFGGKKPTEVVDWLKAELDMIAEAILNQE